MDQAFELLAQHGVLGVIVALLGWAYWQKDRELKAVHDARVEDQRKSIDLVLSLVEKFNDSVQKLTESVQRLEK